MHQWLQKQWSTYTVWHLLLLPLAVLFGILSGLRRCLYQFHILRSYKLPVPVIVVGNISVGGTGKTPLVIWLAKQLAAAGYKPGIISRGYGGKAWHPVSVDANANPELVGDEPVLLARHAACPIVVCGARVLAAQHLLSEFPQCNVLISDDGMQHYRMQRDMEIAVYDAHKGFGNGMLLPAGPLRESIAKLKRVDAVVANGDTDASVKVKNTFTMRLEAQDFYSLNNQDIKAGAAAFTGKKVLAVAGIGNPERFFQKLTQLGLQFESRSFADHYAYAASDFANVDADIIVMTEKDAVKCTAFARDNFWVLPVTAVVTDELRSIILKRLNALNQP